MPQIVIRHVVSASSSDPTHCAENLLKADTYRKWKAAQPGEKQVSVILQFEKEEQIYSVDIGNEGSAFVEVLAGNSASASEQNYEVLLVTSSFMSPSESKSGTNLNRVRMFGPDKLVKAAAEKKWDRVKIVCSQPYSKSLAYGLSFVRFHSPPENNEIHSKTASPQKVTRLGQFKVKDDDSNSSSLKPGALFFNRGSKPLTSPSKASQNNQPSPSYAAASLQSSMSGSPDPSPSAAEKPTVKASPKESTPGKRKFEFSKENANLSSAAKKSDPDTSRSAHPPSKKQKASSSTPPSQKTPTSKKPPQTQSSEGTAEESFHRLLQGTVFVLSGFQNPFRSELRDKALEMGAKYRPDWTPDSTHLICAFANTPKFSQVKGLGGTIVRKEWVLDCYRTRRHLPCKRYLMVSPESSSTEEEEEEESDEETPHRHQKPVALQQKANRPSSNHKAKTPPAPKVAQAALKRVSSEEEEEGPTTSHHRGSHNNSQAPAADSAASCSDEDARGIRDNGEEGSGDTDDELRRVEEEHRKKQQGRQADPEPEDDLYGGSTDENTDIEEKEEPDQPIPELPDIFKGKHFFLYGEFPFKERRLLNRYIIAFNGEVEEYMNEKVNFVITAQEWDDTFEEALNENTNLSFVRPRWIYNCNERQKLIPHQPYVVVPRS